MRDPAGMSTHGHNLLRGVCRDRPLHRSPILTDNCWTNAFIVTVPSDVIPVTLVLLRCVKRQTRWTQTRRTLPLIDAEFVSGRDSHNFCMHIYIYILTTLSHYYVIYHFNASPWSTYVQYSRTFILFVMS